MKYWILIFLVLFSFVIQAKSNIQEVAIVKEYLKAAFDKQYQIQASYMHPDIIDYHPTILAPPAKGKEALINGWKQSVEPMDSVKYHRKGLGTTDFYEGDLTGKWVFEAGLVEAKFKGMNKWVSFQMVGLYRIEDNLIIEVHNYGNLLDMYQQMGYTLVPPK